MRKVAIKSAEVLTDVSSRARAKAAEAINENDLDFNHGLRRKARAISQKINSHDQAFYGKKGKKGGKKGGKKNKESF